MKTKLKERKSKNQDTFEQKFRELAAEMWHTFKRSPQDREFVLSEFDKLKNASTSRPRVAAFWEDVEKAFLTAETKENK